MELSPDSYPRQGSAKVPINRALRFVLRDVKLSNMEVWRAEDDNFEYKLHISQDDVSEINAHISRYFPRIGIDLSETTCYYIRCNRDLIDCDTAIRVPQLNRGVLSHRDIRLSEHVTCTMDSTYFRGVFDMTIVLTTELEPQRNTTKGLGYALTSIDIGSERLKYTGDCMFPDMFTGFGKGSVSKEEIYNFISTY